jgi:thiosulfate dehydrogenase (quinone) large subunit
MAQSSRSRFDDDERRRPLHAPVRAMALSEWALLPLRVFLGVTFLFAGLQKLSNPTFFNDKSPSGIHAQMIGSARLSPLHALVGHLVNFSTPIGIVIAFSEVAIGFGVLFGLWTRVAAIGGALLSFTLFLTVSFHSSPYYTGADIVFFFAWWPFILSGATSRLSIDAAIATFVAKREGVVHSELVAIPFAQVQRMCGHYRSGLCDARNHQPCQSTACPVLIGVRAGSDASKDDAVKRRTLVVGAIAAGSAGAAVVLFGSAVAGIGKLIGAKLPASSGNTLKVKKSTTPTSGATYTGTLLGPASQIPVGKPATFTIPTSGDPGIIFHESGEQFLGYDTVCPHLGCTVAYSPSANLLVCPCHHSEFLVSTGAVISGPAPRGLLKLDVIEEPDGNLYLK